MDTGRRDTRSFAVRFKAQAASHIRLAIAVTALALAPVIAHTAGAIPLDNEPSQVLSANQLEALYGIRVTLLGVTAAGGMVDFRFRVLDLEKIEPLLKDSLRMPRLMAEDSGTLLPEPMHRDLMKHQKLKKGNVYFMLFPNTRDVVKKGRPVSLIIGDLRLEHLLAR